MGYYHPCYVVYILQDHPRIAQTVNRCIVSSKKGTDFFFLLKIVCLLHYLDWLGVKHPAPGAYDGRILVPPCYPRLNTLDTRVAVNHASWPKPTSRRLSTRTHWPSLCRAPLRTRRLSAAGLASIKHSLVVAKATFAPTATATARKYSQR